MQTIAPTRIHRPHPVIRYVNYAIAIVLLAFAAAAYAVLPLTQPRI